MQFDGTTKVHRESGFGLNQLRNRYTDGVGGYALDSNDVEAFWKK
jgi:hypothetical protein